MFKHIQTIGAWLTMVLMLAVLISACGGGGGGGGSSSSSGTTTGGTTASDALFTDPANPVNITVVTDATRAVSQLVASSVSATLTTTAADGSQYTLDIPAYALDADTTITMTPITSASGVPLTNGFVAGVQFSPDGLFLYKDATLTIVPASSVPVANQTFMSYSGAGNDLHLIPPATPGAAIQMSVGHFSGDFLGSGLSGDRSAMLLKRATEHENRLDQEIARDLEQVRQTAQTGKNDGTVAPASLNNYFASYYGLVIRNYMLAAGSSCANAKLATQKYLSFARKVVLHGGLISTYDPNGADYQMIIKAYDATCNPLPNRFTGTFTYSSATATGSVTGNGTVTFLHDDAACQAAGVATATTACYRVESVTYTSSVSMAGCTISPASRTVTLSNTPLTDSHLNVDLVSMTSPTYGTQTGLRQYLLIGYWNQLANGSDTVTCGTFSYPTTPYVSASLASDTKNKPYMLAPAGQPQQMTGSYSPPSPYGGNDNFTWALTGAP